MSVTEAAASGNRRETLHAIRDKLAAELEVSEGRDTAILSKQLAEVIRELDALPLPQGVSRIDQLTEARQKRRAKAASS